MEQKTVSITLGVNDWNVVVNALALRPYGEVAAIVADLQRQAAEQLGETTPAAE